MRSSLRRSMKILALDDYGSIFLKSQACARLVSAGHEVQNETLALEAQALIDVARNADALLLTQQRTPLSKDLLSQMPQLRYILNTGRNAGHIDVDTCSQRGIRLVQAGGGNPHPPAEMTWALILAAARRLDENVQACREGKWQSNSGLTLSGKTLGLYGLGNIGSIVASVGKAFGMQVLCCGRPGGTAEKEAQAQGYEFVDKADLFRRADVLSLHLRYTKETQGIITGDDFSSMKSTAIFVNTSRAGLVQEGALLTALGAGCPGYAALDVFEKEPLSQEDPLLNLPNVLCTPHLGYVTAENMEDYYAGVVDTFLKELEEDERSSL